MFAMECKPARRQASLLLFSSSMRRSFRRKVDGDDISDVSSVAGEILNRFVTAEKSLGIEVENLHSHARLWGECCIETGRHFRTPIESTARRTGEKS